MKLKEGGNACTHLNKMCLIHEELATMGNPVTDTNFFNMVFTSLPCSYNSILTSVSLNMRINNSQMSSYFLIFMIMDEYDCLVTQSGWSKSKDNENVTLSADLKKKKGLRKHIKCTNCSWSGHTGPNCWEEGGGKEGQAPKGWKSKGKKLKSNVKDTKDPKGMKETTKDSKPTVHAKMVTIEEGSKGVWLAEQLKDPETEVVSTLPYAMLACISVTILFDSGASQHFSSYCDQFVNFTPIPPKPITAADKRIFDAVEQSDLPIEIPNVLRLDPCTR